MNQNFLCLMNLDSKVIQIGRPAIDKNIKQVDDPSNHVHYIIGLSTQAFIDRDSNRDDYHRVECHKDNENFPRSPLLAMLDDRDLPLPRVSALLVEYFRPSPSIQLLLQLFCFYDL